MISRKQTALLHVARKQLGMAEDDWRAVLWQEAGARSSRELDTGGFEAVLRRLEALGFERPARPRGFGHRLGMATPEQVGLIRSLWTEYTDGEGDDRSLGKWLAATFKVSDIRFVTKDQAQKAITALLAMKQRQAA